MTRFLKALALSFSATFLAACGFTPVHQTSADGSNLRDIYVQLEKGANVADNQAGFAMTQRLRDRIGVNSTTPKYTLEIEPRYRRALLGITDQDVASRFDITVTAKYKLLDTKTGDELSSGSVSSISTFGAARGPFGVITADNVGVEQASSETADRLIVELARYFAAQP